MTVHKFFICDLRGAWLKHPYVSFWRPDNQGYCYSIPWAGTYTAAEIKANANYYIEWERGFLTRFPVAPEAIGEFLTAPKPGRIDGDVGPVVVNSERVRAALRASARASIFDREIMKQRGRG